MTCHPFLDLQGRWLFIPSINGVSPAKSCATNGGLPPRVQSCLSYSLAPSSFTGSPVFPNLHSTSLGLDLGAQPAADQGTATGLSRSHIHLSPFLQGRQARGEITLGNCCLFGFSQTSCKNVALSKLKEINATSHK